MKKKKICFLASGRMKEILIFFLSGQMTLKLENQLLKPIKLVGQHIKIGITKKLNLKKHHYS